jgi:protein-disulfide isomerase
MAIKSPPKGQKRPPARPPSGGNRGKRVIQAKRRRQRRNQWIAGAVVALFGLVAIGGFFLQSGRSAVPQTPVVAPAHTLGPADSELLGSPSAPVLVEQYGDFQCPTCGRFEKTTGPVIRALVNQGTIKFAFHPFVFIGGESMAEANAAECAGDVGKFWPVHDYFYAHQFPENTGHWTTDGVIAAVQSVGVTDPQVLQCVSSGTYAPWLRKVTDAGSQRGVVGTPTVYVNGKMLRDLTPQGLSAAVAAATAKR